MPKWANGNDQMGQPIPDNKPEVKERRLYLSFNIPMDKNVVGGDDKNVVDNNTVIKRKKEEENI